MESSKKSFFTSFVKEAEDRIEDGYVKDFVEFSHEPVFQFNLSNDYENPLNIGRIFTLKNVQPLVKRTKTSVVNVKKKKLSRNSVRKFKDVSEGNNTLPNREIEDVDMIEEIVSTVTTSSFEIVSPDLLNHDLEYMDAKKKKREKTKKKKFFFGNLLKWFPFNRVFKKKIGPKTNFDRKTPRSYKTGSLKNHAPVSLQDSPDKMNLKDMKKKEQVELEGFGESTIEDHEEEIEIESENQEEKRTSPKRNSTSPDRKVNAAMLLLAKKSQRRFGPDAFVRRKLSFEKNRRSRNFVLKEESKGKNLFGLSWKLKMVKDKKDNKTNFYDRTKVEKFS